MSNLKTAGLAALAASLTLGAADEVRAQGSPASPSWQTLVRCAEIGDEEDRLRCYDEAMRAAGYAPKPEVVAEARRRVFGLTVPQINVLRGKEDEKEQAQAPAGAPARPSRPPVTSEDEVEVKLSRVATQGTGRMLFITDEGQLWEQIDDQKASPQPKEGASMRIKRGQFGSYFCQVNRWMEVRCRRIR